MKNPGRRGVGFHRGRAVAQLAAGALESPSRRAGVLKCQVALAGAPNLSDADDIADV